MGTIINMFLTAETTGFWQSIIGWFESITPSYAIAIIVFTILLKIVLSPLDFFQRKITIENTEKQAKLKPEINKLNEKYKNDKAKLNAKTMELYKKENYNLLGNCLGMFTNLAITLVIFITLFMALRNISEIKLENQFLELQTAYVQAEALGQDEEQAVLEKYEEIKESFLWIENIWRPDTRVNPIPSYEDFIEDTGFTTEDLAQEDYEDITSILKGSVPDWNGLYVLVIIAAGASYVSQKIMKKQGSVNKPKEKSDNDNMPNLNFLGVLLPAIMIWITLVFNSAFSMYIVINSIMTTVISIISVKILNGRKEKDNKPIGRI